MRVFVTGATGWIGAALVPDLLAGGHDVVGLCRSEASAAALVAAGGTPRRGSLEDLDELRAGADDADGVVHLGFIHDFTQYEAANQTDRNAIAAIGEVLAGSDRPFVVASGATVSPSGGPATEDDPPTPGHPRSEAAQLTVALADRGVRSSVVRLPPTTHGEGDQGFIRMLVDVARQHGASDYVDDGRNRWCATHRTDAARVFRSALEESTAGATWHAIAEEGIPTRTIAQAIGRQLAVPTTAIPHADATEHFGWLGTVWSFDVPSTSDRTRRALRWEPTGPTLLEDLEAGHYLR